MNHSGNDDFLRLKQSQQIHVAEGLLPMATFFHGQALILDLSWT